MRKRVLAENAPSIQAEVGELPMVPRKCQPRDGENGSVLVGDRSGEGVGRFTLKVRLRAGRGAVGILGASGAGKSMTLRLIAGVVAPNRGRIVLNGRVLFDSATGENVRCAWRRIGIVFQDYALFPHMTVAENVGFGLSALTAPERQRVVARHLQRMHIAELAERIRERSRAGRGRGWPLRAAWQSSRMRCCWMSRSRRWTRTCDGRLRSSFARHWPNTRARCCL